MRRFNRRILGICNYWSNEEEGAINKLDWNIYFFRGPKITIISGLIVLRETNEKYYNTLNYLYTVCIWL